jgi:hypothetical protein
VPLCLIEDFFDAVDRACKRGGQNPIPLSSGISDSIGVAAIGSRKPAGDSLTPAGSGSRASSSSRASSTKDIAFC